MSSQDPPTAFKSSGGVKRILSAARYSFSGLRSAFIHEAAFRQELLLMAVLVPCAFWLGDSLLQTFLLIASLFFVLIVELLNSAIEAVADAVSKEWHPLLGRAKDMGSAAVMLSLACAAGFWGVAIAA